jgi:hypothetical protein
MKTITFDQKPAKLVNAKKMDLSACLDGTNFYTEGLDEIVLNSGTNIPVLIPSISNGLLATIAKAYAHHIPLALRPDDIWLAIIISFSFYVSGHAGEMRKFFVDHEGKKELVVDIDLEPSQENEEYWMECLEIMAGKIHECVKVDIADWITPAFTTTTKTDVTISHIALMATMREYFSYGFELCCGLSQLKLMGTLEDWKELREKVAHMKQFEIETLTIWTDLLDDVLKEFIDAYQGNVNVEFWEKICTSERRGSGSEQKFRGWFLVFAPFTTDGEYYLNSTDVIKSTGEYACINDADIPACSIDVVAAIKYEGIKLYDIVFYGGLLATWHNDSTGEILPCPAWFIIRKAHLTFQNMLDATIKYKEGLMSLEEISEEYALSHIKEFTLFIYKIAVKYNVPNDKWINLAISLFTNITIENDPKREYYLRQFDAICSEEEYWKFTSEESFAKYFNVADREIVVDEFLAEIAINEGAESTYSDLDQMGL